MNWFEIIIIIIIIIIEIVLEACKIEKEKKEIMNCWLNLLTSFRKWTCTVSQSYIIIVHAIANT